MEKERVGVIGFGNMGQAIAGKIKSGYRVFLFDKDKNKTRGFSGFEIADGIADLVSKVGSVILAVKPQDFDAVLQEIKNTAEGKLIISIAAGITAGYIEKALGKVRVIRAMPNIGAKIGSSVTCICAGKSASAADLSLAKAIFQRIGKVQDLPEEMMNAATAVSGSGPGYYFYKIESIRPQDTAKFQEDFVAELTEAAEGVGFSKTEAQFLSYWTAVYSALLLKKTKLSPGELRREVTSKGGTTEAALEVLSHKGTLSEAVQAAVKRAEELARR